MILPEKYQYMRGYLYLPIDLPIALKLPETITLGDTTLRRKDEFHISLVNMRELPDEGECIREFAAFVAEHPITFDRFTDELRHAVREEEHTIVAGCTMNNLDGLFEKLNRKFPVPFQPAHVTLYMYKSEIGIGISSQEQMQSYEKLDLPEISKVLV